MRWKSLYLTTVFATSLWVTGALAEDTPMLAVHDGVGGEFSAPSSLGRDVTLSEFRGKSVLLFFGYTSCQDVCPATLSHLHTLMKRLGAGADDVQVLLATVDPENDTPEHLRAYLAQFDSRFIGLTGTREQADALAKLFMVDHSRSHGVELSNEHNRTHTPVKSAYLYSHSQQIYLLDKQGRTRALFFTGSPLEEMQAAVLALLEEPAHAPPADGGSPNAPLDAKCRSGGAPCPHDPANHGAHQGTEGKKG
ncbi:MAG: SCO family protein [bacterium]|nr:SCO family protein [bacterium]